MLQKCIFAINLDQNLNGLIYRQNIIKIKWDQIINYIITLGWNKNSLFRYPIEKKIIQRYFSVVIFLNILRNDANNNRTTNWPIIFFGWASISWTWRSDGQNVAHFREGKRLRTLVSERDRAIFLSLFGPQLKPSYRWFEKT